MQKYPTVRPLARRAPAQALVLSILCLGAGFAAPACSSSEQGEGAGASALSGAGAGGQSGSANGGRSGAGNGSVDGGNSGSPSAGRGGVGAAGSPVAGGEAGNSGEGGAPSAASGGGGNSGSSAGPGGNAGTGGAAEVDCRSDGDGKTTLVFVNGCSETLTFRGSDIDDGSVAPGSFVCVDIGSDVEELSAKRYWGFWGEDPGAEHHTLAEFTFNTDFNDFDWYNISHVDAFNLPMQIVPVARESCTTLTCAEDLLPGCPDAGKFENDAGELVSCVSPARDDGNSEVALYFEQCDDAYAWSGDDQNGEDPSPVRACAGEDWEIVFCPEGGA